MLPFVTPILGLTLLTASLDAEGDLGEPKVPAPEIVAVATHANNALRSFQCRLWSDKSFGQERNSPIVMASSPWGEERKLVIEIPEYTWGRAPSDQRNGPIFFGRAYNTLSDAVVRYPEKMRPAWSSRDDGGLTMDVDLADSFTIMFRVIPHDGFIEIRWGLANKTDEDCHSVWSQLCVMPHMEPLLSARHPTSSFFWAEGRPVTWDSSGMDLTWVESRRIPGTDRFTKSSYFIGYTTSQRVQGTQEGDVMHLDVNLDAPVVAKVDSSHRRAVLVYSPSADKVFYNVLVPCFHSDPHMGTVKAGETKWTQTYIVFYEGNVQGALRAIVAAHKSIAGVK